MAGLNNQSNRAMKILTFTTLYPNNIQHRHGIFVEQRLRQLLQQQPVTAKVVAPVPWFPFTAKCFGSYSDYARIAQRELRHGIEVYYPRYPVIPKIGMTVSPMLLAMACLPLLKKLMADGYDFDVLDAHYFYPDGVAAAWLAKRLGKPLVVTARGSDINLIPRYLLPRQMILWAAREAKQIITVCEALKTKMVALGVDGNKIRPLRNGVDLLNFCPKDRADIRSGMGLSKPTLLSVGHLIEIKGHHFVIEAMSQLPGFELLIAGDGEQQAYLKKLSENLNLTDRIRFLGTLTQQQLADVYNAADALVLASSHEGWANVLLEAMACGTPVVATAISGTPEVVRSPEAGVLVHERSADGIALGVKALFANCPARQATRQYAEKFSWDETVAGVYDVLDNARHA